MLLLIKITFTFSILFLSGLSFSALATDRAPEIYKNSDCIACHKTLNPMLVADWKNSSHARSQPITNCISCHGKQHSSSASSARKNTLCIQCHGGTSAATVHSYNTSKHGVIMQLEQSTYDWSLGLELANYRVPSCAYCHMYQAQHNVDKMIRHSLTSNKNTAATTRRQNLIINVCQDCHAPRYISQLLQNAQQMLEIAQKKVSEADKLIKEASTVYTKQQLSAANLQLDKMQHHLKNVYLGAAHQSPDYQWWHGQPALDGDLIRIKSLISDLYQTKIQQK